MVFWIVAVLVLGLSLAPIVMTLSRGLGRAHKSRAGLEVALYKEQLKELDRDIERGLLEPREAEATRIEISRRLIDASEGTEQQASAQGWSPFYAGAFFATLAGLTVFLYVSYGAPGYQDLPLTKRLAISQELYESRDSQAQMEAQAPDRSTQPEPQYAELLDQLRAAVSERPEDLQGLRLLVRNEALLGNFNAAYRAQAQLIAALGSAATAQDYATQAELMIEAAGGYVSPEAEALLQKTLSVDPDNGPARYYFGALMAQIGRPDRTFELWEPLLASSSPNAPWVPLIRERIEEVAFAAGISYTPSAPQSGPSIEDIAAAEDLTPEERRAMIEGMVNGLAERLATDGGPATDWARLIAALATLGEGRRANDILQEAELVFAEDPQALRLIRQTARDVDLLQ